MPFSWFQTLRRLNGRQFLRHGIYAGAALVLGGTWEPGEWSLEPNMEAMHKIMNRHMDFANRMK
jgi:hypothetical protein